ncbi:MAG TPA: 4a-hydroxytetrahydrobiopterin dehydratase [Candidatus Paceibacterota bacterium]|nr:4a-hydroxytetrahydrobiopterin dehydratase [Candidatus Paceibacterota bacterium]
MANLARKKCIPCEKGVPPLTREEAEKLQKEVVDWALVDDARLLAKSYRFKNFVESMEFVNKVADIAEEEGHHPDITISYSDVGIELTTHAIDGLSENDFILAAKIDEIKK